MKEIKNRKFNKYVYVILAHYYNFLLKIVKVEIKCILMIMSYKDKNVFWSWAYR